MTDTKPPSSEWFRQFYDQTIHGQGILSSPSSSFGLSSDGAMVTTVNGAPDTRSTTANGVALLTPNNKGNSVSRPIRRRSRSSKKIPTTLLNANTSNFRALVQQFTGCRSRTTSLGYQKGPVNLNFQLGSVSIQNQSVNKAKSMASLGNSTCNYNQQQRQIQPQQRQQERQKQELEYVVAFDDVYLADENIESTTSAAVDKLDMMPDGLLMDDVSLHEFSRQVLFDQILDHGYF